MATVVRDIRIPQGSTYQMVVDVPGGPVDLTGYTGQMQFRDKRAADGALLASVPSGSITVNPGTRQVIVTIPVAETINYKWETPAHYDLRITGPTGDSWRLVEGHASVSVAVAR